MALFLSKKTNLTMLCRRYLLPKSFGRIHFWWWKTFHRISRRSFVVHNFYVKKQVYVKLQDSQNDKTRTLVHVPHIFFIGFVGQLEKLQQLNIDGYRESLSYLDCWMWDMICCRLGTEQRKCLIWRKNAGMFKIFSLMRNLFTSWFLFCPRTAEMCDGYFNCTINLRAAENGNFKKKKEN